MEPQFTYKEFFIWLTVILIVFTTSLVIIIKIW